MFRVILAVLLLAPLASCTTVSEDECRNGDWDAIGFQNGIDGRDLKFIENHAKACAPVGVRPDAAAWEAGREDGLVVYCTPLRSYLLGRRGIIAKEICPADLQSDLTRENRRGLNARLAILERRKFNSQIGIINPGLLRLPPPVLEFDDGRSEFDLLDAEVRRAGREAILYF